MVMVMVMNDNTVHGAARGRRSLWGKHNATLPSWRKSVAHRLQRQSP